MELFREVVIHTSLDSLKILPFLFGAFLLIERLEHYTGGISEKNILQVNKAGPLIGALVGCIPQCGFSVAAANFYAERVISKGTLLAVFIATSDEAVLIILANPDRIKDVGVLLLIKISIAVVVGYGIDKLYGRKTVLTAVSSQKVSGCQCSGNLGSMVSIAAMHTIKIFLFLFLFSALINLAVEIAGEDGISKVLLDDTIFQPVVAAALGLIPNCLTSVLLPQLYLEGMLSFPSLVSGLCTNAGLGLLVLIQTNEQRRDTIAIILILYSVSVLVGLLLTLT